jgi:CBS domain-containing protein
MSILDICQDEVIFTGGDSTVEDAASLMKSYNIGALIVTENNEPVGIITDRDIVVNVVAEGDDASAVKIKEVMSDNLLVVSFDEGIYETIEKMKARNVRRAPVIDAFGKLIGIVSVDDLIPYLISEGNSISSLIKNQTH